MLKKLLMILKKIWNKKFHKSFTIDFTISAINEAKIFSHKETFEEFMKMFKNDYIERLGNKDYQGAEVMKDTIERLINMYNDHYEKPKDKKDKTETIDVITQLQVKMQEEAKKIGQ